MAPFDAYASHKPLVESNTDLNPAAYFLTNFTLYETQAKYYLVGRDKKKQHWQVLKIDRTEAAELNLVEDPVIYTEAECKRLLNRVDEGNKPTGGLQLVTKAYGIVGFIKFMESYYMILITKRRQIGSIYGHAIYSIEESQLITVPHPSVQTEGSHSRVELRYKKLLLGVDLTKDFYFSYTYCIMQNMQANVKSLNDEQMPYDNMFVWNTFLTSGIRQALNNTRWTVALVHGFFEQEKLSIFGRIFVITLIGRRSRHFAGTRYLKRGVNYKGRVANDVETEQLVMNEETGIGRGTEQISSVVQHRGSIPLFWSQEMSRLSPKPDIILQRFDPIYHATKLHFEDLSNRYGNPIIILSLIKTVEKRPREMMLRREFADAVGYLNQTYPEDKRLCFIHWDFHKFAKSGSKSANVLAVLGGVAAAALDLTGFYYSGKAPVPKRKPPSTLITATTAIPPGRKSPLRSAVSADLILDRRVAVDVGKRHLSLDLSSLYSVSNGNSRPAEGEQQQTPKVDQWRQPRYQNGVLRTNCIDCLDRTNVAQYAYGLEALGRQLQAVGLTDTPKIDPDSGVAATLMDMYQNMGDCLALQYGGSEAHNYGMHSKYSIERHKALVIGIHRDYSGYVFPERQGKWKATTQSQEFLKSIRRYYSNTITDGEKQDAMNLFLGHFQPEEGKPELWDLETDYYLHAGGQTEEYFLENKSSKTITIKPLVNSRKSKLCAASSFEEDFHRLKLTSFDKLQATLGPAKSVRMYGDSGFKRSAVTGVASDAAEVQLRSPNWLYGEPIVEKSDAKPIVEAQATGGRKRQEFGDLDWLTSLSPYAEEELFTRYIRTGSNEDDSWYGTSILPGTVEGSEANRHYLECCKTPAHDFEDLASIRGMESTFQSVYMHDEEMVRVAMEAALSQYNSIGSSDLYSQMLQDEATPASSTNAFYNSLPRDNQLCRVLS